MRNLRPIVLAFSVLMLASQAFAAGPTCHPFVRVTAVEDQGNVLNPSGDSILIDPSEDTRDRPFVDGGMTLVPLNANVVSALSALPAQGTVCVGGTQTSFDTFLTFSAVAQ